jgi:hypothetical protein
LLRATLEQAELDGYVLWSGPDVTAPIRDLFPDLLQPNAPAPKRPAYEKLLTTGRVSVATLGRLPFGFTGAVIPRSDSVLE